MSVLMYFSCSKSICSYVETVSILKVLTVYCLLSTVSLPLCRLLCTMYRLLHTPYRFLLCFSTLWFAILCCAAMCYVVLCNAKFSIAIHCLFSHGLCSVFRSFTRLYVPRLVFCCSYALLFVEMSWKLHKFTGNF